MERPNRAEHGQTLVIFVFAIIGLLVMVGLAIDGGTVLLERRRMQNAADAAALAGTRELAELMCDDSVSAEDGDQYILSEVRKYAQKNGVRNPSNNTAAEYMRFDADDNVVPFSPRELVGNSLSGGDGIPDGAAGISATTKIDRSTHFVTLIGIHSAGASAPAIAVTGPLAAGGGLRPFGVPIELVEDLDPDDPSNNSFSISFKNDGGEIIWAANIAQHRGWMNLDYAWNQSEDDAFPRAEDDSTSASELKEWMENGWQGTLYADCLWFEESCGWGDYVHAKPGTNSSAICKAPGFPVEIIIPVYDYIPDCPEEPIPDPKPDCPTQGGSYSYHIVGFAGTRITHCSQGGGEIDAELVRLIMGQGVPSPNDGYGEGVCEETALTTVTLWE
jgi:hypothetical protein